MAGVRRCRVLGSLLTVAAISVVMCWGLQIGAQEKLVRFSFALPEGEIFNYKTSQLTEQNFQGMTFTRSHSADVELSLVGISEKGLNKVSLSFSNEDASLLRDDELMDYELPIKLEGETVYAFVNRKGVVEKAEAASAITGLSGMDELKQLLEDWFVRLPDSAVSVGQEWRIEILKKGIGGDEGEPEVKGWTDFKLKKIEVKDGLEIAEIEGKTFLEINRAEQFGTIIAEGKGEIKTKIAVVGGYIIECKRKMDVKGKIVGEDPITGKESESKTAMTDYFECKLQR